jgi:hypothetical protein
MLAEIGVKPEKIRSIEGPSCKDERVRFSRRQKIVENRKPDPESPP